jgi:hypothetical protein
MDWWIGCTCTDHLNTPFGTTCNYSPIYYLHTLQITRVPACYVYNSRSLTTTCQVEILQIPALTSLLSYEYLATELLSTVNSTIAPSLLSLPCRAQLKCQPSTIWAPGWPPFHTSLLVFCSQAGFQLTTDNWTGQSQSQSYVTTDGQSASLSWNKAPIWGLRPDLYYCQTVAGLLLWGALSHERTGLSFARLTVSRNKSVVSMYSLHFTCYYICICIKGLCQSRLSTADHALSLVAPAIIAV